MSNTIQNAEQAMHRKTHAAAVISISHRTLVSLLDAHEIERLSKPRQRLLHQQAKSAHCRRILQVGMPWETAVGQSHAPN